MTEYHGLIRRVEVKLPGHKGTAFSGLVEGEKEMYRLAELLETLATAGLISDDWSILPHKPAGLANHEQLLRKAIKTLGISPQAAAQALADYGYEAKDF
jgi:hypothetical protein